MYCERLVELIFCGYFYIRGFCFIENDSSRLNDENLNNPYRLYNNFLKTILHSSSAKSRFRIIK